MIPDFERSAVTHASVAGAISGRRSPAVSGLPQYSLTASDIFTICGATASSHAVSAVLA